VGHFGGQIHSLAVAASGERYVYLGQGNGFVVVDASDPGKMRTVASVPLSGGEIKDIVVVGTTAYIVNVDGLVIADVSNPLRPVVIGRWDAPGIVTSVDVAGDIAYVAGGTLYVVNVSDPAHPLSLAGYKLLAGARDIKVRWNTAYVAGGTGLLIIDVSDPAHPVFQGAYETPGSPARVDVDGLTAYVADKSGGLQVIDVNDRRHPKLVSTFSPSDIVLDVVVRDKMCYVAAGRAGLIVLDVNDPANISKKASIAAGYRVLGSTVRNDTLYVMSDGREVRALDVGSPAAPVDLGAVELPREVLDIVVEDTSRRGYLTSHRRFWVLDMTDPALPIPLGNCVLPPATYVSANRISVEGTRAYVAVNDTALAIIDVSDPFKPAVIGEYVPPGAIRMTDVAVVGSHAFVLAGDLFAVDASNPSAPVEVGTLPIPGGGKRIAITDTIAYIAAGDGGLSLVSVRDPANPVELSSVKPRSGYGTYALAVDTSAAGGTRVYVANTNYQGTWLLSYDVTDPKNPALVSESLQKEIVLQDLDVVGDYVYGGGSLNVYSRRDLKKVTGNNEDPVFNVEAFRSREHSYEVFVVTTLRKSGSRIFRHVLSHGTLTRIEVTPGSVELRVGETRRFTARGYDSSGNEVPVSPAWNASGGTITSSGVYTATTVGSFTVTAAEPGSGITGTAVVRVVPGDLARIEVTPDSVNLHVGDTLRFTAAGYDAKGDAVAITPAWTATGGVISQAGLYMATAVGRFTVNAMVHAGADTMKGSAIIRVDPGDLFRIDVTPASASLRVGDTLRFTAKGYDANGDEVTIAPAWSASGGTMTSSGLYTATTVGSFTVTAAEPGSGVTGTAIVRVAPGDPDRIEVTPGQANLKVGDRVQFTATGYDAGGNQAPVTPTWSATGGAITPGGLYAATATGNFIVTASVQVGAGIITGTATVHVIITGLETQGDSPKVLALDQNYPNPFGPGTVVRYRVNQGGRVLLCVYNMRGEKLATLVDSYQQPGKYGVVFHGNGLANGVYLLHIELNGIAATRKIVLAR